MNRDRKIFSIESIIGGGKSTFLSMLEKEIPECTVIYEPVDEMQNINGENLLHKFYADPTRFGYTFQNFMFVTRINKLEEIMKNSTKKIFFLERSWFCDYYCFSKLLYELGNVSKMELDIYQKWFNWLLPKSPNIDGFIFLKTDVDIAMKRMRVRNRSEEVGVSIEYQRKLFEKHEEFYQEIKTKKLVIDGNLDDGSQIQDLDLATEKYNERKNHVLSSLRDFVGLSDHVISE